jgi:hypothetical protein
MNTFVLTAINSAAQRNVMLPPVAMLWFIRTFGDSFHRRCLGVDKE